jgi:FkbM family methyltransferase
LEFGNGCSDVSLSSNARRDGPAAQVRKNQRPNGDTHDMIIDRVATHTIYAPVLSRESVVLDLGANLGEFSHELIRRYDCLCHAVEPSPATFARIPEHDRLTKHNVAICQTAGPVDLHLTDDIQAASTARLDGHSYHASVSVRGMRLTDFIADLATDRIDLCKMDIEGAEIGVLDSCADELLSRIGQVTIEFHEWAPSSGVRPEDVRRVMNRMRRLGFHVYKTHPTSYYDVLFINRRVVPRVRYLTKVWLPRAYGFVRRRLAGQPAPRRHPNSEF